MERINFLLIFLSLSIYTSCEQEDYEFGDIVSPTALTISASLQGSDADTPYGDGSGYVTFTATAADAITYKFIRNGVETMVPSGVFTTRFTTTGVHIYTMEVVASGTAGIMSNGATSVEVLYTFEPPAELVAALTTGSWRVMAESAGHLGVHSADSNHTGIDNDIPAWYSAGPFDKADTGMYDDRMVFSSDGSIEYQTQGSILGKDVPLESDFSGPQDRPQDQIDAGEYFYYATDNFTSGWSISEQDGYLVLNLTGNGFAGFYVGGDHTYRITSWNSNEMYLKTIGFDNNAWYTKITNQE